MTAKDELCQPRSRTASARKAEATTLLRLAGGLLVVAGKITVDAEVDHLATAQRLRKDLYDVFGCAAVVHAVPSTGPRVGNQFLLRVTHNAEELARQTGLIDRRGRPVRGLPSHVVGGNIHEIEATWRGAFLARGSLSPSGQARGIEVVCPGPEAALALVGAARRLGVSARAREARGADRVAVRDSADIETLLQRIGAPNAAATWTTRQLRPVGAASTATPSAGFQDANQRRSAHAANVTAARVERALDILGDKTPPQLAEAGQLRIRHREAALEELGRLSVPPLSKDAVAGRIRRLLALADRHASRAGLPDTNSPALSAGA